MGLGLYVGYILQLIMQPLIATNHLIDKIIPVFTFIHFRNQVVLCLLS